MTPRERAEAVAIALSLGWPRTSEAVDAIERAIEADRADRAISDIHGDVAARQEALRIAQSTIESLMRERDEAMREIDQRDRRIAGLEAALRQALDWMHSAGWKAGIMDTIRAALSSPAQPATKN